MNKKFFGFIAFLIALFVGAINYSPALQTPLNHSLNSLKSFYIQILDTIDTTIQEHFFQAENIRRLHYKLENCKKNTLLLQQYKSELTDLMRHNNANFAIHPHVKLVRSISYEKFGNMNRIWLDVTDYNASKIYGLVYKRYVAGIVIPKENMPLALLNRDQKSSYAVSVGEVKAPGIAHGNNGKNIIVTFIPTWYNINVGDEVVTSGLDNIFFRGLKVGKVLSLTTSEGYQKAVVKPYYNMQELNYFYMITQVR